jgi:putative acetyltransferase
MSAVKDRITIQQESPDQPEVRALLDDLDSYLGSLYEPEANHLLSVAELMVPEVAFFVMREGPQALGTGAYRRMQGDADTGGLAYGEIKRMYVDPARRGEGLARRLLSHLETGLRQEGYALALLETGHLQAEAVRLYERGGYRARAAFGGYPDNGLSAFYEKRL